MTRSMVGGTFSGVRHRTPRSPAMSDQSNTPTAGARRIQVTRRPRRETYHDTTLTDSWPPRLNTAL